MPKGKKQPKKIGKCSDCQQVKTIYCKGLCASCYNKRRYDQRHPYLGTMILCACGCGQSFKQTKKNRRYLNRTHKIRANRRYGYLGYLHCPICGKMGSVICHYVYDRIRDFQISHYKSWYDSVLYKQLRAKGVSSLEARKKTTKKTLVKRCYWNPY